MAPRGIDVHALQPKIGVIIETLNEAGLLSANSKPGLAEFFGIEYEAFKTGLRIGRLSLEMMHCIASAAKFDPTDKSWIDERVPPEERSKAAGLAYPGCDTTAAFRAMLRKCHGLPGIGITARIVSDRPRLIDTNLATFSIEDSGQGSLVGEPSPIFFSGRFEPGVHSGLGYGFQRVRIRLTFSEQSNARLIQRLGDSKLSIKGALLNVRGDNFNPEWILTANPVLDGEVSTGAEPLCQIVGHALGDAFNAEIAVRPSDGALVAVDGRPLPDGAKRQIIQILLSKKLPGVVDSQGWLTLGTQPIRIVRADNA
jgi:hypothetical protein